MIGRNIGQIHEFLCICEENSPQKVDFKQLDRTKIDLLSFI